VQSILNNSNSSHGGNIAPITAFTGREPDSPLRSLVFSDAGKTVTLDAAQTTQLMNIQVLRASVEAIHKQAYESAQSNRASARLHKPPSTLANYDLGDFVLVAKREFRGGVKLSLRWNGPQRIVSARSDYVFDVEDILTKVITPVHATRLRFYHDSSLDETVDLLAHIAHQNQGYEVRKLVDLRYDAEACAYFLLVSWLGFEDADNSWEPLDIIYEDLPQEVLYFLRSFSCASLAASARATLPQ
jgi:hypothetical protein